SWGLRGGHSPARAGPGAQPQHNQECDRGALHLHLSPPTTASCGRFRTSASSGFEGVPEAPWVRILGQEVNVMLASLWTFLAQYGGGSGGNGGGGTGGGGGYSAGYRVVVAPIAAVVLALVICGIRRLASRRSSAPAADSNPR